MIRVSTGRTVSARLGAGGGADSRAHAAASDASRTAQVTCRTMDSTEFNKIAGDRKLGNSGVRATGSEGRAREPGEFGRVGASGTRYFRASEAPNSRAS